MYKIKNLVPGMLSIQLEQGSVILESGKTFDLDQVCSRKWIKDNAEFTGLKNRGCLVVVFDSEKPLPKHDLLAPPPNISKKAVKPKKLAKPVIIDLGPEPEVIPEPVLESIRVDIDDLPVDTVTSVEAPCDVEPVVEPEEEEEDPVLAHIVNSGVAVISYYNMAELQDMSLTKLREIGQRLGLSGTRKSRLVRQIVGKEKVNVD